MGLIYLLLPLKGINWISWLARWSEIWNTQPSSSVSSQFWSDTILSCIASHTSSAFILLSLRKKIFKLARKEASNAFTVIDCYLKGGCEWNGSGLVCVIELCYQITRRQIRRISLVHPIKSEILRNRFQSSSHFALLPWRASQKIQLNIIIANLGDLNH